MGAPETAAAFWFCAPLPEHHALWLEAKAAFVHRDAARHILSHRDDYPPGTMAYGWAMKILNPMGLAVVPWKMRGRCKHSRERRAAEVEARPIR